MVDPLHAIRAFFHHSPVSDSDVRVVAQLAHLGSEIGILIEIEAANFVRTVVGTVAGANTAVINHVI
jgi:hypothetical protein